MKLADARRSNRLPLFIRARVLKDNSFFDVALHLPDVAWMGLGNVDDIESRSVLVLFVKLIERGNLPAEWRSSITAEYKDDRLGTAQ